jgi:hypothetical protein
MSDETTEPEAMDPKDVMRRALEAKQGKQAMGEQHGQGSKVAGGPHKAATGKRQFRRKSGSA